MTGVENIYLVAGEAQFGTGEAISAKTLTEEATALHLTGAVGKGALIMFAVHTFLFLSKKNHTHKWQYYCY